MYRHHSWQAGKDIRGAPDQPTADRQTAGLIGIVVILLLLVCSLYLVQQLRERASMEDCFLSGRSDCAVLATVAD